MPAKKKNKGNGAEHDTERAIPAFPKNKDDVYPKNRAKAYKQIVTSVGVEPAFSGDNFCVYNNDVANILPKIRENSVDLILTKAYPVVPGFAGMRLVPAA